MSSFDEREDAVSAEGEVKEVGRGRSRCEGVVSEEVRREGEEGQKVLER